jgi:hypothetical protein
LGGEGGGLIIMEKEYEHIRNHCLALYKIEPNGDPWVFVCASVMIDFLRGMTGCKNYSDFVNDWLSKINPLYRDFKYLNEHTKLAEQMYFILRNGLVHSFTLKPNRKEGKTNSILLSHNAPHLKAYTLKGYDSCIFNARVFIEDIVMVVDLLFEQVKSDEKLRKSITDYFNTNPPIGII